MVVLDDDIDRLPADRERDRDRDRDLPNQLKQSIKRLNIHIIIRYHVGCSCRTRWRSQHWTSLFLLSNASCSIIHISRTIGQIITIFYMLSYRRMAWYAAIAWLMCSHWMTICRGCTEESIWRIQQSYCDECALSNRDVCVATGWPPSKHWQLEKTPLASSPCGDHTVFTSSCLWAVRGQVYGYIIARDNCHRNVINSLHSLFLVGLHWPSRDSSADRWPGGSNSIHT